MGCQYLRINRITILIQYYLKYVKIDFALSQNPVHIQYDPIYEKLAQGYSNLEACAWHNFTNSFTSDISISECLCQYM